MKVTPFQAEGIFVQKWKTDESKETLFAFFSGQGRTSFI